VLRYFTACMVGAIGTLAGLGALYWSVQRYWPQYLPPPAITRLEPLDDKLRFLRQRPDLDPRILAVGSSITWRQLVGSDFVRPSEEFRFLNGGTALLKTHQTRAMVDWYLQRYRHVETIINLVALPDFDDCSRNPALLFDPVDAAAYAFGKAAEWPFYLKYFTPLRYARTARNYPRVHVPLVGEDWLDPFGSSPLYVQEAGKLGLHYGPLKVDPACIDFMAQISAELAARGLRLVVVFAPVHPDYRSAYPQSDLASRDLIERVKAAVAPHGTRVVVAYDDAEFKQSDFFDAFHLQEYAVRRLSKRIASLIVPGVED